MAYLFPLAAVIIWSGNNVVNRLAAGVLHPAEISFYRWLLAGLLLTPVMLMPLWRQRHQVRPWVWHNVVLGLLGMVAYQSLAYYAGLSTSATNMGIILSLVPLLVLLLSTVLLAQALALGPVIGALISLVGVLVLVSGGDPAVLLTQGVNVGDLLMLMAALAYALYGVLFKRWKPTLSPLLLLYLQVLVGIVVLFPLMLLSPRQGLSAEAIPLVLYAGVAASVGATWLWMNALTRLDPNRVSLFFNLVPLFTATIAAVMLRERLTGAHLIGGALTLAGVMLAELWRNRQAPD